MPTSIKILPVDRDNSDVCFNGLCTRERLLSSTFSEFKLVAEELMDIHIATIHSIAKMDGRGHHSGDQPVQKHQLQQRFHEINQKMLSSVGLKEIMKCSDSNYFWNKLKSL